MQQTLSFLGLQNLDLLSVALAIAAMGVLGFAVFWNNRKSLTNRLFFMLSLSIILWSLFNYASYQFASVGLTLWLLRLVVFSATWFAFFIFYFLYSFPSNEDRWPTVYRNIFLILGIVVSALCLTPFVFNKILEMSVSGGALRVLNGPGIILFSLTVLIFNLGGVFYFLKKTMHAPVQERSNYWFVLSGIFVTLILILLFNFIFPAFFNNPSFIKFGALFLFPFVALTSYAILRNKLFNIRIAATVVLVFLLSVVTFFEIIFADNLALIIYRCLVLVFVLLFGILLIRSVLKEVEQREKIEKIEKELERAYAVEKKANEQLKALDSVKNQFLMTIQHHLRTPLTSMRGYADLLLDGTFGEMPEKIADVVKKFEASTTGLIKMVNDFLDVTQFQLGKQVVLLKDGVNLSPMLEEIIGDIKLEADKKGINLKLEKPEGSCIIKADESKLKAAIVNIFDNSVKYTKQGGVTMTLKKENGNIKIEIKDTGMGITPDRLPKLFDSTFERTDEAKKTFSSGRGIGLYLSSQIIKAHKGKIWAESEGEGKGSTFFIELPIKQ